MQDRRRARPRLLMLCLWVILLALVAAGGLAGPGAALLAHAPAHRDAPPPNRRWLPTTPGRPGAA